MRNAENDLAVCEKAIKAAMQSGISVMGEEDALLLETARESLPYWINRAQELEERLQIDPQGNDKIDELEQALEFCKYERDKVRKEVEQLREALKHACIAVEIYSGSCPYDKHDSCQFPGRCTDQYSECWQEYFISKVKPPGERTDSK